MSSINSVSQRDLRLRSREVMDAVERGERLTVTRGGREIAELVPLRAPRRFITRDQFVELGRGLSPIDPGQLRADLDAVADPYLSDPYER